LAAQAADSFTKFRTNNGVTKDQLTEITKNIFDNFYKDSTPEAFKELFKGNGRLYGQSIAALKECGLIEKPKGPKKKNPKKAKKQQQQPKKEAKKLDFLSFHPLDADWMNHQPTINLMTIGHVANGKSTTMKALSDTITMRHTKELINNMTIKLGYTSFKIWKIPGVPSPDCYVHTKSAAEEYVDKESGKSCQLVRHFSFIDNPGHAEFMTTMLVGASVADGALLIIAANAPKCPEKQTAEHLAATCWLGLRNLVVAQNKIDLVKQEVAAQQYEKIVNFLRLNGVGDAPVVPICAEQKINMKSLCAHLVERIDSPRRILNRDARLRVIRSFDVNKPCEIQDPKLLKGGVAGCVLMQGFLKVGDQLEVRPGLVTKTGICPIFVKVESLSLGNSRVEYVGPGCNVGVGLNVDPYLTKQDELVGQVLGVPGTLPPVFKECVIEYMLNDKVVGAAGDVKAPKKLRVGDKLNVALGSMTVDAEVLQTDQPIFLENGEKDESHSSVKKRKGTARILLEYPVCYDLWTKLLITKSLERNNLRLVGCGRIRMAKKLPLKKVEEMEW